MGKIFDSLKKDNPGLDSHAMNVFMARLLFCFFAEDSGIFEEERLFTDFIERATASDGSDLREQLERAFAVMNLPPGSPERAVVPVSAARFPYVNGGLFQGVHAVPRFSSRSRKALIDAGESGLVRHQYGYFRQHVPGLRGTGQTLLPGSITLPFPTS